MTTGTVYWPFLVDPLVKIARPTLADVAADEDDDEIGTCDVCSHACQNCEDAVETNLRERLAALPSFILSCSECGEVIGGDNLLWIQRRAVDHAHQVHDDLVAAEGWVR